MENMINEELGERNRIVSNLRSFFTDADVTGNGTISWEQLMTYLNDNTVKAYFKSLHLEISDLRTFFELLNHGGDDLYAISIDQFVRGCLRLKGPAKSADVAVLRLQIEALAQHMLQL